MYTDEQLDQLEQEEHSLTEEAIITMLLLLSETHMDLENELRNFYQKYGKDGVVTYQEARKWVDSKDSRKRIFVLYYFLNDRFLKLLDDLKPHFETMLEGVIKREVGFFGKDVDIEKLLLKEWGADEANWLDRLEDDITLWESRLINDIKVNFLTREHIDDVLDDLDARFTTMESVLKKLALTESTAVGSIARREIFKHLGISKYRFYTRPDERRCEQCGSLHGLVFPISAYEVGVTASPIHPRCRCWEVPITE